jgi:hypothetical protein
MTKTSTVLLLAGVFVWSLPSMGTASPSARLAVGATVVRSCKVKHQSDSIGLKCSRGGTDRVVVSAAEPRLVTLERDGATMAASVATASDLSDTADRFVTLQF